MQGPKEEDEEYIVIKAGPPLPIRKPRKSISIRVRPPIMTPGLVPSYSQKALLSSSPNPPCKTKGTVTSSAILSNKVTQTITTTKSPVIVPNPIKSRPHTPTLTNVESKVKQYIEQVKKFDEENRSIVRTTKPDKVLSLEDLYQVSTTLEIKDNGKVEEKLRETLRIIKEKDEMINELRESCHSLKLKWADAENRIDEMRFGFGYGDNNNSRGQFTSLGQEINLGSCVKRSFSEVNLSRTKNDEDVKEKIVQSGGKAEKVSEYPEKVNVDLVSKKDQATETDENIENENKIRQKSSKKSQPNSEDYDLGEFDLESRCSQFDPVLEEKCSNWLEKVQNWRTDALNNISQEKDKDSCGDRDSGFRGSAELEAHHPPNSSRKSRNSHNSSSHHLSKSTKTRSTSKLLRNSSLDATETTVPTCSKSPTPERSISNPINKHLNAHNNTLPQCTSSLTEEDQEQSGPPSLQIAPPWFTFSGNVNPQSATEYEGFPSLSSSSIRKYEPNLYGGRSIDALNVYGRYDVFGNSSELHKMTEEDHRQLLRNIEKRFKTLNPLLDDATNMALRVKRKSENLAKLLRNKNDIDRHRLSFS